METLVTFVAVACLVMGWLFGKTTAEGDWGTDCQKIGQHVAWNGKVYTCAPKEKQ